MNDKSVFWVILSIALIDNLFFTHMIFIRTWYGEGTEQILFIFDFSKIKITCFHNSKK